MKKYLSIAWIIVSIMTIFACGMAMIWTMSIFGDLEQDWSQIGWWWKATGIIVPIEIVLSLIPGVAKRGTEIFEHLSCDIFGDED